MKTLELSLAQSPASIEADPPSGLRSWLLVLHRCNPALSWGGWVHVPLLLAALLLLPFDDRTVTGLNVWIKPIKFALAGIVFLWSLAWLLADLPGAAQRAVRWISRGVALSMVVEIVCIFIQAARGTTSHFNLGSAFDGMIFGVMGIFITLSTGLLLWALVLMLRYRPFGPAAYVWGMRLGLLLFLVGSAVGSSMVSRMGHTVGAPDGGPGLPVLGWSTRYGDLRAAHFLGLHALQVLPLAGWLLARWRPNLTRSAQTLAIFLFALLYAGAVGLLYWRAVSGLPLLALR
ncbi:hypothetical protein LJY25_09895 [Hymenobacter sp. BT175]|uniref:hypothetical protein n=1 Tax=Hymenobacter translucens TaxID=2886507 RepID=UPI001D0E233A|nr:hypothetical protein [Hymenobacter translucens]MCC2546754.1 hypothetical protein [Hymenobacter translucens]